jgi:hypothetical protein
MIGASRQHLACQVPAPLQSGTRSQEEADVWLIYSHIDVLPHQDGVKIAALPLVTKCSLVP